MHTCPMSRPAPAAIRWLTGFRELRIPGNQIHSTEECRDLLTGEAVDFTDTDHGGIRVTFPDRSVLVADATGAFAI